MSGQSEAFDVKAVADEIAASIRGELAFRTVKTDAAKAAEDEELAAILALPPAERITAARRRKKRK